MPGRTSTSTPKRTRLPGTRLSLACCHRRRQALLSLRAPTHAIFTRTRKRHDDRRNVAVTRDEAAKLFRAGLGRCRRGCRSAALCGGEFKQSGAQLTVGADSGLLAAWTPDWGPLLADDAISGTGSAVK
jgi:hypothetical protein